jgi:hypothetical protein
MTKENREKIFKNMKEYLKAKDYDSAIIKASEDFS